MKAMDHQPNIIGAIQTVVCFVFTCFAWVSLQNVQVIAAIVASIVAAISGTLAGINWYYSIKEKRQAIKTYKNQN